MVVGEILGLIFVTVMVLLFAASVCLLIASIRSRYRRVRELLSPYKIKVPWLNTHTVELVSPPGNLIPHLEAGLERFAEVSESTCPQSDLRWMLKAPGLFQTCPTAPFTMRATLKEEGGRIFLTIRRIPMSWLLLAFLPPVLSNARLFLLPALAFALLVHFVDISGAVGLTVLGLKENGHLADSTSAATAAAK